MATALPLAGLFGHRHRRRGHAGAVRPVRHKAGRGTAGVARPGLDAGPRRRHQRRWAGRAVRCPRVPAHPTPGHPTHRPGAGRAARPSSGHRRQGGHPSRSAWHDRHPRPRDRLSGGGHGAPAGPHPGRQAHPTPRGRHGCRGRVRGLGGRHRPVGRLVQGVAGGWAGSSPQPVRNPPTPGSGSAERARPGADGRSWTWPQPSASSPGPGATVCAPAPPSSTNPPRSPSRPPPTPSGAPCLRSWPRAPTLILASKPTTQRGRQVVRQPEPDDTGGLRGAEQTPFSGYETGPRA